MTEQTDPTQTDQTPTDQPAAAQPAPAQPPAPSYQPTGYQPPSARRRLTRPADDSVISGVCGGLARYLDIDATLVRVATVIALVFTGFFPVGLAYLVAWVLMPKE